MIRESNNEMFNKRPEFIKHNIRFRVILYLFIIGILVISMILSGRYTFELDTLWVSLIVVTSILLLHLLYFIFIFCNRQIIPEITQSAIIWPSFTFKYSQLKIPFDKINKVYLNPESDEMFNDFNEYITTINKKHVWTKEEWQSMMLPKIGAAIKYEDNKGKIKFLLLEHHAFKYRECFEVAIRSKVQNIIE